MLCNKDVEASQTGNFAGAVKDTIIKHSEPRTCNGDCSTTYIIGQGTDNPPLKDMAVKEESKTALPKKSVSTVVEPPKRNNLAATTVPGAAMRGAKATLIG